MKRNRILTLIIIIILLLMLALGTACTLTKANGVKDFKVTFIQGDTVIKTTTTKDGDTVGTAYVPTAPEGYVFDGWFTDKELTISADNLTAIADIVLYARFVKKSFTVIFADNNGDELKRETVEYGEAATAPDAPTIPYQKFTGWDKDFDNVISDLLITAQYSQQEYKLSFVFNNEEVYFENVYSGVSGKNLSAGANSARNKINSIPDGFDFDCWLDEDGIVQDFTGKDFIMPQKDYIFTARLKIAELGNITVENQSYQYGSSEDSALFTAQFDETVGTGITYAYEWLLNDVVISNDKSFTASGYDVGKYPFVVKITASADDMQSVQISNTATLTVNKGELSGFSAENVSVIYDGASHGITVVGTSIGDKVSYSTDMMMWFDLLELINAGQYHVYYKVCRKNYAEYISEKYITVTIEKATLTVTADDKTITYGDTLPTFSISIDGYMNTDTPSCVNGKPVFSCGTDNGYSIGTYDITPFVGAMSADNYKFTFISGKLNVIKRNLTITADNKRVTYGDDIPSFSANYDGFIKGEDYSVLNGALNFDCAYTAGSAVTTTGYVVTPKGLTSNNYEISFVSGTLTVDKKSAIVTADSFTLTYGDDAPAYSATETGTVLSESINYTLECSYTSGNKAGSYTIIVNLQDNPNYDIIVINGSLTIGKRNISVYVNTSTAFSGNVWSNSDWNISGLFAGDEMTGTLSTVSAAIGVYTAATFPNDDFIFDNFDIVRDSDSYLTSYNVLYEITVEIYDATIEHSVSNFLGDYDGKAHSITVSCDLPTANITYSTDGITYSTYNPSYITAGTYNVYYKIFATGKTDVTGNAVITIRPITLLITADNKAVTFGDDIPTYSAKFNGFIGTDNADVLAGTLTFNCDYTKGSGVCTEGFIITPSGLTSTNYAISFISGRLTVDAALSAVTWDLSGTPYIYNGTDQLAKISAVYTDIFGASITADVTISGAGTFIAAGNYTLTATTSNANYALTNDANTVTMEKGTHTDVSAPAAFNGTTYSAGITLESFALPENYRWKTPNTAVHCNVTEYPAIYNTDTANYYDYELSVTINLQKAAVTINGATVQEADYSGNAVNFDIALLTNDKNISGTYTIESGKGTYTAACTYGFTVTFNATDYTSTAKCYLKIKGVKVDSTLYTIEDALNVASSGKTVIVTTDTSFADDYNSCYGTDLKYYTVKSGVNLLVPYDANYLTATTGSDSYSNESLSIGTAYVTLTMPSNVKIILNGILTVNAKHGNQGNTKSGHTIGNYGVLDMKEGSKITANSSSTIYSNGYIIGTGIIELKSGANAYELMAIKDWRGGTVVKEIYETVFPFHQYSVANIEARLQIYSGAYLYTSCLIYIPTINTTKEFEITLIGSKGLFECSSGYIEKSVDTSTGKINIDIYGNIITNAIKLSIQVGISILSKITIDTSNYELPLCGYYNVNIKSGSTTTISNKMKLLPGASINVDEGGVLNIASGAKFFVFSNPALFKTGGGNAYGGSICAENTRLNKQVYNISMPATITVNGTLEVMSGASFGGVIQTTNNTGKTLINSGANINDTFKQLTSSSDYTYENVNIAAQGYMNGATILSNFETNLTYISNEDKNTWVIQ